MYKNSFVHYLTKVLLDVIFYGGILCCIALPFVLPSLISFLGYTKIDVIPLTIILLTTGLCLLYILWQLKLIFKTLIGGNPFTDKNINCLKKCSAASLLIAVIYLLKILFWPTAASSLIVIIFSLLGLFCLTLKDVFKQAVAYKEENDWTV